MTAVQEPIADVIEGIKWVADLDVDKNEKADPPSRMAFKRTLDSMDPKLIQRITAKVKYLKGELKALWF